MFSCPPTHHHHHHHHHPPPTPITSRSERLITVTPHYSPPSHSHYAPPFRFLVSDFSRSMSYCTTVVALGIVCSHERIDPTSEFLVSVREDLMDWCGEGALWTRKTVISLFGRLLPPSTTSSTIYALAHVHPSRPAQLSHCGVLVHARPDDRVTARRFVYVRAPAYLHRRRRRSCLSSPMLSMFPLAVTWMLFEYDDDRQTLTHSICFSYAPPTPDILLSSHFLTYCLSFFEIVQAVAMSFSNSSCYLIQ
jgi:hypothetical protein